MTNLVKYSNPQVEIGQYVQVLVGASGYKTSPLGSNYIPPGTYNQSDYPELFDVIGYQTGAVYTPRTSGITSAINALTYGNGLFVYAGGSGVLSSSTDAITWTSRTSGIISNINGLIYANGLFVYGGGSGIIRTSTDAITWTSRTSGTTEIIYGLTYGNGIYVYVGSGNSTGTSTDAITWTSRTLDLGVATRLTSVSYGNGLFVACGSAAAVLLSSTDGINWVQSLINVQFNALTYENGLYVAVGAFGVISTSTNGFTWTSRTSGTTSSLNAVIYGNGLFVAAGTTAPFQSTAAVLITSTDAITWTSRSSGAVAVAGVINALVYANGLYVYGGSIQGSGNFLATSTTSTRVEYTTYDYNTQFDVPSLASQGALTVTSLSPFSTPQNVYYIRAK